MRKSFLLIAALTLTVTPALAQVDGKPLLKEVQGKLTAAKSLTANYTLQMLGGSPNEYTITLSKPNLARLDGPTSLVVADGANLTFYNKKDNTYYKQPQTEESLAQVFTQENARLWLAFFNPDTFAKVPVVKNEGLTTRRGIQVTKLTAILDTAGKRKMVLYVDANHLPLQQEVAQEDSIKGNSTLLLFAKDLQITDQPLDASKLAFKAPDNSRELSLDEVNASKWYEDLEEAKAAAARTHKLIMVDFYADW